MCLNARPIYNNSILRNAFAPAVLYVPCGHCEECFKQMRLDYSIRNMFAWYEAKSFGGYSYWDTLTFSPQCLPYNYEMPSFNKKYVQKFFKDLRRQLEYHFPHVNIKSKLKYMVCCERGEEKGRPHMHCLFHVSEPFLDVRTLKRYINKCWKYGQTDSMLTTGNRILTNVGAINYVCKYVTKGNEDDEKELFLKYKNKMINSDKYTIEDVKKFSLNYKKMKPFKLFSNNLGYSYLAYLNQDLLEENKIIIDDKKKLKKECGLPMYYQRKLFYDVKKVKDDSGKTKVKWTLNERGIQQKVKLLDSHILQLADRYETIANNLAAYVCNSREFSHKMLIGEEQMLSNTLDLINSYLGDREWSEFATYVYVYKGRYISEKCNQEDFWNYDKFYELQLKSPKNIVNDLASKNRAIRAQAIEDVDYYTINQNTIEEFMHYDDLLKLLMFAQKQLNQAKQKRADEVHRLEKVYSKIIN